MKKTNCYPIILVHGFLCWGDSEGLNKIFPTFGMWNGNAKKAVEAAGVPCFAPSVGPLSGLWDRACELYAYIKGGRTDYGKVHSARLHHERYGPVFAGAVPDWGELDAEGKIKKVSLIGHSFGGPTVRTLIHLLAEGSKEEREGTDPEELSSLFRGGKVRWVHSCTTLAATHNGVTLPDAGRPFVRPMAAFCFGVGMLLSGTPIARFYRWHLDRFGISDLHHHLKFDAKKIKALMDRKEDNIFYELSTEGGMKMTEGFTTYDNIYYITYNGARTKPAPLHLPIQVPTKKMWLPFRPMGAFEGFYKDADHGRDWQPNDVLVNVPAAQYPLREPHAPFVSNEDMKPGIWYYTETEDKDHVSYMGIQEKKEDYAEFFRMLTDCVTDLPVIE